MIETQLRTAVRERGVSLSTYQVDYVMLYPSPQTHNLALRHFHLSNTAGPLQAWLYQGVQRVRQPELRWRAVRSKASSVVADEATRRTNEADDKPRLGLHDRAAYPGSSHIQLPSPYYPLSRPPFHIPGKPTRDIWELTEP